MITYRQLLQKIQTFSEEQLDANVTIFDIAKDEHYGDTVEVVFATEECDTLDPNHPVIRY